MSEPLPDFRLLRPETLDQALAALAEPGAKPMAGGTDLVVNLRRGLVDAPILVDLSGIAGFATIELSDDGLTIGAGVTLAALAADVGVAARYQAIHDAAEVIAGPGHRAAATVGGNLCLDTRCLYYNQSHWWRKSNDFCLKYRGDTCHVAPKGNRCRAAFSGDLAPALMVFDAIAEIAGPDGRRSLPLAEMYHEDGADYLTLAPGEIVVSVRLPATTANSAYDKIRVRGAVDFPLAGVAIACRDAEGGARSLRLAVTGTNSMPLTIEIADLPAGGDVDQFCADLEKAVQKAVSPQRTTTIQPHYRRLAASALARRLARRLL
ncbi:MAG: 4-hydroxybenzoyl-CoA reductase subunit beta [Rhodobacteraceae bacterium]|nr:4-hydroxybenzoyl-CoA reductase subunit beta [Paracoccaceae bacterium]